MCFRFGRGVISYPYIKLEHGDAFLFTIQDIIAKNQFNVEEVSDY